MNHIYRSLWNESTQTYVAVSEAARAPGGSGSGAGLGGTSGVLRGAAGFALKTLAAATLFAFGTLALANPSGGTVSAGSATINTSGSKVTINQGSQNAAINWQNFSIGSGESVVFVQPNSSSVALNRVTGGDPSTILGSLSANGQVFLVNPNGILFGKGASVNVQGLVASTLGISDADFMAGKYGFAGGSTKSVSNLGSIAAADGGYVALLGASVSNQGTIAARLGTVALAAGQGVTLDVAGDSLLKINVDQGALNALVDNGGLIQADGGQVLMTAQAAGQLLNTVVNNTGVVQAQTVQSQGGVIKLLGDMSSGTVNVGGTLDASAPNGGNGGQIETSAASVKVASGTTLTTLAPGGQSGTWLIDPSDFTIASGSGGTVNGSGVPSGDISGATLTTALAAGNVTILSSEGSTASGSGNIYVDDTVGWALHTLTLTAANNIVVGSSTQQGVMNATGTAALVLNTATANGADVAVTGGTLQITAAGTPTGGIGGSAFQGQINLASTSAFTMNGHAYTIISSLGTGPSDATTGTLQGVNANLSGYYVLGTDIDAKPTSQQVSGQQPAWSGPFTPLGAYVEITDPNGGNQGTPPPFIDQTKTFSGVFEGLGHTITDLTISQTQTQNGTGMFGAVGGQQIKSVGSTPSDPIGIIQDVQLVGPQVQGVSATGALVGFNGGIVNNDYVTGTVAFPAAVAGNNYVLDPGFLNIIEQYATYVGGLVGENLYHVTNSYSSARVSSDNGSTNGGQQLAGVVGGLVGVNADTVSNSAASGSVTGYEYSGGLVGESAGTITNSSATGAVGPGSTGGGTQMGGLVGINSGTITGTSVAGDINTFSFAKGNVTGNYFDGGLVGQNSGTITLAYATGSVTSSNDDIGGLVGLNQGGNGGAGHAGTNLIIGNVGATGFSANISESYSTGAVSGSTNVGGLIGFNAAGSGGAGAAGCDGCLAGGAGGVGGKTAISQSFSSSNVSGSTNVGGLIGQNASGALGSAGGNSGSGTGGASGLGGAATLADTYSTGTVTGTGTSAGGLVGLNVNPNSAVTPAVNTPAGITTSYTTSTIVGGGSNQGLVVGTDSGGAYTNVYYLTQGSSNPFGSGSSSNVQGLSATDMTNSAKFVGFDFTTPATWGLLGTDPNRKPTLCALTIGCTVDVYIEVEAKIGSTLTNAAQTSVYGNTIPDFEDVLVTSSGNTFTLPSGVTAVWSATPNRATPPGTNPTAVVPSLTTSAGTYSVAYLGGNLTFTSSDQATQTLVNSYVIVPYTTQLSWTVNRAQVVVSAPTVTPVFYTGSTVATLSTSGTLSAINNNSIAGTGIYSTDLSNVTLVQAATGSFATKNAGPSVAVTYTDTLTGSAASNYQLVQPSITGTISPAPLIVSGTTVAAKTYDGQTGVAVSGGVLRPGTNDTIATTTGVLSSDVSSVHLSAATSGNFTCANVGCTSVIVVDSLTGSAAGNYVLTQPTPTGTIAPAPLTLVVNTSSTGTPNGLVAAGKVYDGTTLASVSGPTTLVIGAGNPIGGSGIFGSDDVSLATASVTTGTFASADALTHAQTVTIADTLAGAQAGNYTLVLPTLSAIVTPAPLVISGSTANSKTYDGTTAATLSGGTTAPDTGNGIGTATGIYAGDAANVQLVQVGTFASPNAGSAQAVVVADTLTGSKALDYVLTQPGNVTAAITKAPLTVVNTQVASKTYDGTANAQVAGGALAPVVTGDPLTSNNIASASGVYSGDAGNVTLVTVNTGTFGSVNASSAAQGVTVADSITGSAAGNYFLVQPTLSAFINPAPLTVSGLSASNKVYDGTTTAQLAGTATLVAAPGNTIGGVLAADAANVTLNSSSTGEFASRNASSAAQAVATTDSLTLANGAIGNYVLVQPAALSAKIAPAQLLVAGTSVADRTYDGTATAALGNGTLVHGANNVTGVISGDDVTLVQAGSFASSNASSSAQAVTASDSLAGTAAGNYVLAQPTGLSATISPAPLTVSGTTAATRTYNGTTTASLSGGTLVPVNTGTTATSDTIATATGVLPADAAHLTLVAAATGNYADANASSSPKAVTIVDSLGGSAAGNYVLVQPTVSGIVNPAPLTATGTTVATRTYDGTTTATLSGATLAPASGNAIGGDGVYSGDTAGVVFNAAATGTFASANANANPQAVAIVDGVTLSGSAIGNYVWVQPTASGTITPAPLTVSGTSVATRTYNGTSAATLSGGTLAPVRTGSAATSNNIGTASGVLAGDVANLGLVLAPTGTFASVNASSTAQAVTVADALSGSASGNYVLVEPALTGFINPAPLTVTGTTVAARTYDGTTAAALSGGTLAASAGNTLGGDGVLSTDASSVTLNLAATGNYAVADAAANARSVSVNDSLTLSGPASGNYVLVQPTLSGVVTQAPITVAGTTVVTKTYNGNTQATLTSGTFAPVNTGTASTSNHIAGDGVAAADVGNLVLNQAGTYAGSNASSSAQVVTAADSLSGSAASNYVLVEPTGLAGLIAPAPLTVGNTVVTNKTYNGSNAAVVSGGQLIAGAGNTIGGSGVLSADAANVHLTTVTGGTFASANASSTPQAVSVADTLAVSGSAAGNYVLVEPTLTGVISPAPLTVSGSTVSNKTYDGTRTATLAGGTLAPVHTGNAGTSDTIGTSTGVLAGDAADVTLVQTGSFASVNASPNAQAVSANDSLQLTGSAAGNYVLVQPTGLSGVISPAPITVSGATVVDKTYNGTNAASFTGGTLAPATGNNIGGDGVVASDAANLRLTQTGTFASVNANPNPQAVTANDALSGSAASNYVLVEPTGLAGTISPAPVTVSGTTVATRTYDGTTTATLSGGTLSAATGNTIGGTGVLSSDAAFVSLQTAPSGTFASPNASSVAQSVSVTDTLTLTGTAAGNYVLIQPATLSGFINPAPLTVTGSTAASKTYDGTTAATVSGGALAPVNNGSAATSDNIATPSGVLAADASGVVLVQSGNFAGSNASSSAQTVTVHDSLVLTGPAAGNYVLVQPANLSATITPATLTITAAANTKTYDGTTNAAAMPVVSGLAAGTTVSGVSESYTSANVAGANGSTLVVNGGIVVNDGNFGNNYTLVTQTGTGTITQATLTVIDTLVGNKVYDATKATSVSGGVLVGLFNNDDVTLSQSGAFTSANAGPAVPVALNDAISGTAAGNYVLQQPTGLTGVISPAPLTVAGTTVASKVFDGSNKATLVGGSLVGVLASDAGSVVLDQGGTFTSVVPSSNIAVLASDSLTGAAAGNYTIAQPTGLFGNITPNPLMPNAASIAGPLLDAFGAALSGRTAPLVASADDGGTATVASAGAGAATGDASASAGPNGAPVGTPTGTESNTPEKRRLPALSGLNISVVEDGIKLPAASVKQSP